MQFGAHIFGVGALANPQTLAEVAQLAEAQLRFCPQIVTTAARADLDRRGE